MFHVWHMFARILPEARAAIARVGAFLRARLWRWLAGSRRQVRVQTEKSLQRVRFPSL